MLVNFVTNTRFYESRRKALLAAILDSIRNQPSEMLSFEAVRACLNVHGQIALGHQIVPVKHIIGSEGRYSDFDRRFLPITEAVEQRWRSVERAMDRLIDLPPVDLWKISDVYFVRDGNHRVSVARWRLLLPPPIARPRSALASRSSPRLSGVGSRRASAVESWGKASRPCATRGGSAPRPLVSRRRAKRSSPPT